MKRLYFIAIPIPSPLAEKIIELKKELAGEFNSGHSLKSIPHITLQMPVRIEEEYEDEFTKALLGLSRKDKKDKITLKGIDCFGERTIFIDIRKEGLVVQLFNAVRKCLRGLDWFPKKCIAGSFHPHISLLTRDLEPEMFRKAYPKVKDLNFDQEILIDRFCLFKHDGKKWKVRCEVVLKQ